MLAIKQTIYPSCVGEALALLRDGELQPFAGGTDLIPAIRDDRLKNRSFLMLTRLSGELSSITEESGSLRIGAMTLHREICESKLVQRYVPTLADACGMIGSSQIRNRATIGGNLVNASPAADSVPALIAAGAFVELSSHGGTRIVAIADFASAPGRTVLRPDELVTAVIVPVPEGGWKGSYFKAGIRNALTISVAGAAMLHNPEHGWKIALGSVAPTVLQAPSLEQVFNDSGCLTKEEFAHVMSEVAYPIDDVRASANYRLNVLTNILYHAYEQRG